MGQYFLVPLLAALDVRFRWTVEYATQWQMIGAGVYSLALGLTGWAMISNAYFSTAVRIQCGSWPAGLPQWSIPLRQTPRICRLLPPGDQCTDTIRVILGIGLRHPRRGVDDHPHITGRSFTADGTGGVQGIYSRGKVSACPWSMVTIELRGLVATYCHV